MPKTVLALQIGPPGRDICRSPRQVLGDVVSGLTMPTMPEGVGSRHWDGVKQRVVMVWVGLHKNLPCLSGLEKCVEPPCKEHKFYGSRRVQKGMALFTPIQKPDGKLRSNVQLIQPLA
jgi:hypothetical protein